MATGALKAELAGWRVKHARAVRTVAAIERVLADRPTPTLADAVAAMFGSNVAADNVRRLAEWRIRRDIAAASVRYLEGRLGTVNINDE